MDETSDQPDVAGPYEPPEPPDTAQYRCTGPDAHVLRTAARAGDRCPHDACPGKLEEF